LRYSKGYKYRLERDELFILGSTFRFSKPIVTDYIELRDCTLLVREGYSWDGASGPTRDTKNAMRGPLCHDTLYQLMREGHVDYHLWKQADEELYKCLKKDGMSSFRVWYWKKGLRSAKGKHARPKNKKIYTAP